MTDIFLSYTEKDREVARRVASTLEAVGWKVWWDRRIPAGETWRSVLENALEDMRCMVVLWSSRSIESEWVYEEASEGRRLGKLMPVMIEAVRPPAGFREIQAADLTGWDGSRDFDGMQMLIADLEALLGKPGQSTASDQEASAELAQGYDPEDLGRNHEKIQWWQAHRKAILAAIAVLVASAGTYLALPTRHPAKEPPLNQAAQPEPPRKPLAVEPPFVQPVPATPATPVANAPPRAPEPVAITSVPATVDKLPPKTLHTPTKQATTPRTTSARCADLLNKVQLGESLSDADQSLFRKACQ